MTPLWLAAQRLREHASAPQTCVYVYTGDLQRLLEEYDTRGEAMDAIRPYFQAGIGGLHV